MFGPEAQSRARRRSIAYMSKYLNEKGTKIYMKDDDSIAALQPASHLFRISPWSMRRSASGYHLMVCVKGRVRALHLLMQANF
jgi:hypothetical protein